jgi:hypothetical protein
MKAARLLPWFGLLALAAILFVALAVSAGDSDDPEITDVAEDSTSNRASHDIVRAWITDDNSTITVSIEATQLDAFSPLDDWRSLPTTIYEYYFSIDDKHYMARATIPVHGLLAVFAGFSLHEVNYEGNEPTNTTSVDDSIPGSYLANSNVVEMTIDKGAVGEPTPGDLVTHMWAAAFFQPRGGDKEEVDRAMSFTSPGRDYTITGSSSHYYMVELRSSNATIKGRPREVASFNISIRSKSTTNIEVNISNSSLPIGYFVNVSRGQPIPIPQGGVVYIMVLVSVPDNATNGTNVPFHVWANFEDDEGTRYKSDDLNLLLQIRFIPPRPPEREENILTKIWDFIKEYYIYISIIIVLAIVGWVGFYFYENRQKKLDKEIIEYQAYLEAQRQQREIGE